MLVPIFLSSVLGSIHCAGMCGGFVALYSAKADRVAPHHVSYNLGRLLTYLILGGLAGIFGAALDRGGSLLGVQYFASILLGLALILSGMQTLLGPRLLNRMGLGRLPVSRLLGPLSRFFRAQSKDRGPLTRTFLLGLTSTFLPCGWLYSFLVIAAATGQPFSAMAVMFVFWLGSLPALLLTGLLSRQAGLPLAQYAPKATAVLLICIGFASLLRHDLLLVSREIGMPCHEGHSTLGSSTTEGSMSM